MVAGCFFSALPSGEWGLEAADAAAAAAGGGVAHAGPHPDLPHQGPAPDLQSSSGHPGPGYLQHVPGERAARHPQSARVSALWFQRNVFCSCGSKQTSILVFHLFCSHLLNNNNNNIFYFIFCFQVGWLAGGSGRLLGALPRPADCGRRGTAQPPGCRRLLLRGPGGADGEPEEGALWHHCQVLQWTGKSSASLGTPPGHPRCHSGLAGWDFIQVYGDFCFRVMSLPLWKVWREACVTCGSISRFIFQILCCCLQVSAMELKLCAKNTKSNSWV